MNSSWIHIGIWTAVILVAFGLLWWRGQIQRISAYVQETREELNKCAWPSWIELRGSTILIIVTVAILSAFIFIVDQILVHIFLH